MKFNIKTIVETAQANTEELIYALSGNYAYKKTFEDIVNMATLHGELFEKISFEDLTNLYSHSYDVWLKVENISIVDVTDFVAYLLNEKLSTPDKIINTIKNQKRHLNASLLSVNHLFLVLIP